MFSYIQNYVHDLLYCWLEYICWKTICMFCRSPRNSHTHCAIWLQTLSKQSTQQMFLWLPDCTAAAWHVPLLHPMFAQSLLSGRKHHQLWAVLCQNWGTGLCQDGKRICICTPRWINDNMKIVAINRLSICLIEMSLFAQHKEKTIERTNISYG